MTKDTGIFYVNRITNELGFPEFHPEGFPIEREFQGASERFIYKELIHNKDIKPFGRNTKVDNLIAASL